MTWDGLEISDEAPYGVSVLVRRELGDRREWLLLHRAHHGPDYAGDWAWGPPAGCRLPGEPVDVCAERELREETGLALACRQTGCGDGEWLVYVAEAPHDAPVVLSAEHDRFEWVELEEAVRRCLPARVGGAFACAAGAVSRR